MSSIPIRIFDLTLAVWLVMSSVDAWAQTTAQGSTPAYPVKPVRLIVPFPAGASSDIVGRMLGQKIAERLGEQVIADNRAGVGGNLGLAATAKAPPDGYTIGIATGSIALSPSLYVNPGYDAVKDLAPIARLTNIPNILLVHPSVPARTLREFINLARASPGKLNYGSGGIGTTNHLANELLKHLEKINIVHVPYKGSTQAMVAMMGGEVDEVITPVSTTLSHIRAGRVRALAVLNDVRVASLPDVPTSKEAGVDNYVVTVWYGMFAPAATPKEIIARLGRELVWALQSPEIRKQLTAMGVDPWPGTPEQLGELLRADIARYGAVVRSAGMPKQ
jgi:tripartite-type tricarboxylate transporter receptor subunit TctC